MTRRGVRRHVRHLMRYRVWLAKYPGPVTAGWPERIERDIRAWIGCLR